MKKVVGRKLYDTDTAEILFTWCNYHMPNDYHYCEEVLYRTKKGAYFIAGKGGPASKYAVLNGREAGDGIEPLTGEEALQWLESHEGEGVIERYFRDMIEEA